MHNIQKIMYSFHFFKITHLIKYLIMYLMLALVALHSFLHEGIEVKFVAAHVVNTRGR